MRIAFDGRSLASQVLRGWDRYAVGLIGGLVRQGVEVTLFHRARQPLHGPHTADLGCRVVGLSDLGGHYFEQVAVPLALRRGKFDLYHAPFERGVPLLSPCPVVLTIHSVTTQSYEDLVRRGLLPGPVRAYLGYEVHHWSLDAITWHLQINRAHHILTPSEFCRGEVIRLLRIPPDRVTATPLAVDEQFLRPAHPEPVRAATLGRLGVRKPYLLFVGGYEPHKNVRGLLESFALIRAERPDLSLVVVGSKSLPEGVRRDAERLGLRPGREVVFLVNITEELVDLYDDAELMVTLSWRETFCLPALEAMSRGVPVVASIWGASPEVIAEAGRLVDPRDPAAAKVAIAELLAANAHADRASLRRRLQARAQRFDWEATATQTIAIYERLIHKYSGCTL
ncbi:MAG: glycosyltransferase family 4 protein, partial [Isosphaeraceae bacterium]|nr:glycosyltransferase family 4 protein [Isosphaeraceae bacterium]